MSETRVDRLDEGFGPGGLGLVPVVDVHAIVIEAHADHHGWRQIA
jgi:hypothetical protein